MTDNSAYTKEELIFTITILFMAVLTSIVVLSFANYKYSNNLEIEHEVIYIEVCSVNISDDLNCVELGVFRIDKNHHNISLNEYTLRSALRELENDR